MSGVHTLWNYNKPSVFIMSAANITDYYYYFNCLIAWNCDVLWVCHLLWKSSYQLQRYKKCWQNNRCHIKPEWQFECSKWAFCLFILKVAPTADFCICEGSQTLKEFGSRHLMWDGNFPHWSLRTRTTHWGPVRHPVMKCNCEHLFNDFGDKWRLCFSTTFIWYLQLLVTLQTGVTIRDIAVFHLNSVNIWTFILCFVKFFGHLTFTAHQCRCKFWVVYM